jgi:hypothetical protein
MESRSAIALCALVIGLSGLTGCQPPHPRIAMVEWRTFEPVASTGSAAQDIRTAFDRSEEATRVNHPDGLLIISSTRSSRHEPGDAETAAL